VTKDTPGLKQCKWKGQFVI